MPARVPVAGDKIVVSLPTQLAAVEREIPMRERVYPNRVAAGRMTITKADHELAAMRAVAETLRGLQPQTGLFNGDDLPAVHALAPTAGVRP